MGGEGVSWMAGRTPLEKGAAPKQTRDNTPAN